MPWPSRPLEASTGETNQAQAAMMQVAFMVDIAISNETWKVSSAIECDRTMVHTHLPYTLSDEVDAC